MHAMLAVYITTPLHLNTTQFSQLYRALVTLNGIENTVDWRKQAGYEYGTIIDRKPPTWCFKAEIQNAINGDHITDGNIERRNYG